MAQAEKEMLIPHIHPHAFRHSAASTMIANGVDLVTAANELGHANATTTATIYAHQIEIAKQRQQIFDLRPSAIERRNIKKMKPTAETSCRFCVCSKNRLLLPNYTQKLQSKFQNT